MGVLAARALACAAAGWLVACYSPAVRDCTLRCGSGGDCAEGQVCGADGKCAAPEVAGRCAAIAPDAGMHDAAGTRPDAGAPRDATEDAAPPDASRKVRLAIQILGKGSVVIEGHGTCSALAPQRGSCTYDVVLGAPVALRAMAIQSDQGFATWTSLTCAGQGPRCVFTPVAPTTVSARFVKIALQLTAP